MKYKGIAISDVDGCLTDNTVGYSNNRQKIRFYDMSDGHGVQMLRDAGILTIFLSGENDANIRHRADKLNVEFYSTRDKLGRAERIMNDHGLQWKDVAFLGNDVMDIPLLEAVNSPACPNDARRAVKEVVLQRSGFITNSNGGHGAFRDFAELYYITF